jgi:phosphonate transport system permease protein
MLLNHRDPAWRARLGWSLLALVLCWPILVASEFKPWTLLEESSRRAMGHFLGSFFPPELSREFLLLALQATWKTIAIATAGLSIAFVLAVPMALAASSVLSISSIGKRMSPVRGAVRIAVRALMVCLRSVPELVFALLFVRLAGLGPTAGVLAIGLTYAGMLAKVYAEILESSDRSASKALLANGASRLQAFLLGSLPQCASELVSYTVYRWECAIRGSVIMGFVGAGGLGQQIDTSTKMFAGGEVCTLLAIFVLLVMAADAVSRTLRRRLG